MRWDHRRRVRQLVYCPRDRKEITLKIERQLVKHARSFCGKDETQTQRLSARPSRVFICNEGVALCNEILAESLPAGPQSPA